MRAAPAAVAGRLDLLLPLVVVFVAMLTAPHMVVVERLWRHRTVCVEISVGRPTEIRTQS